MNTVTFPNYQSLMNPQKPHMPDPSPEPEKTPQKREDEIRAALLTRIEGYVSHGAVDMAKEWISSYKIFMEAIAAGL